MVSDNENPSPGKFTHVAEELVIDLFSKLWLKANITLWYNNYVSDYANYAYKMYNKTVSLLRLKKEAVAAFLSHSTFVKIFVHFFDHHILSFIEHIRDLVAANPDREFSADANVKIAKLLRIWEEYKQHAVNVSLSVCVCNSTNLIGNISLYPGKGETHERISELILKPVLRSLNLATIYKPLAFGIGIDNAPRDYGLADVFVKMLKDQLSIDAVGGTWSSPTGLNYDITNISAMVKCIYVTFRG